MMHRGLAGGGGGQKALLGLPCSPRRGHLQTRIKPTTGSDQSPSERAKARIKPQERDRRPTAHCWSARDSPKKLSRAAWFTTDVSTAKAQPGWMMNGRRKGKRKSCPAGGAT